MRSAKGKRFVLLCALAAMPGGLAWPLAATAQSTPPSSQTPPPKAAPKKPPQEPIDPDETAGVRGSSPLTVHVLSRGKAVQYAHVLVKNTNGTLAGSCFTSASGACKVDVGPDDYEIDATGNGRSGTLKMHVSEKTSAVTIKLLKAQTAATTAKP